MSWYYCIRFIGHGVFADSVFVLFLSSPVVTVYCFTPGVIYWSHLHSKPKVER